MFIFHFKTQSGALDEYPLPYWGGCHSAQIAVGLRYTPSTGLQRTCTRIQKYTISTVGDSDTLAVRHRHQSPGYANITIEWSLRLAGGSYGGVGGGGVRGVKPPILSSLSHASLARF